MGPVAVIIPTLNELRLTHWALGRQRSSRSLLTSTGSCKEAHRGAQLS